MGSSRKNPRNRPRTQMDVDKAFDKGMIVGSKSALTVMLYVMHDKLGASEEELRRFSGEFNDVIDSMARGYITKADLSVVLKEEYGTVLRME